MKKLTFIAFAGLLFAFGCSHPKLPKAPQSADAAKQLLMGKTWTLKDLGFTKATMGVNKSEAPEVALVSEDKELDEFTKTSLKKHDGTKFEIESSGNGKAFLDGFTMYGKQSFDVINEEGIQLKIKADSAESKAFGMMKGMTISYKILGIGNHKLLLETSNQINGKKVVYLMECPK